MQGWSSSQFSSPSSMPQFTSPLSRTIPSTGKSECKKKVVQPSRDIGLQDRGKFWRNGTMQMSPSRPYDSCANIPWLAPRAFTPGHLHHAGSSISLLITHPRIRSWPGLLWHYREIPSPNSPISAQNCCCFYSSNKAGPTVYIVRHCKE